MVTLLSACPSVCLSVYPLLIFWAHEMLSVCRCARLYVCASPQFFHFLLGPCRIKEK
jgi:hypothetical protein